MRRFELIALVLLVCAGPAQSAAPPRPDSGCGVLFLPPAPGERLCLYREPGVARLAEVDAARLPRLGAGGAGELLAVSGRSGGWSRIGYDEAGRQGWVEERRGWRYRPWQEFLPGRQVALLSGLKRGYYALRAGPDESGGGLGEAPRGRALRIVRVQGDWALAEAPAGWFRWRDLDGRLTISLLDARQKKD